MLRRLIRLVAIGACIALPVAAQQPDTAALPPVKPFARISLSALSLGDSIVALARQQIGKRYVLGGESPKRGFDCSGLVQYVADLLHLGVPRTAREQARVGQAVATDTSELRPGDLLTFGRGRRISHIGIYAGNGRFIHASVRAGRIIETTLRPRAVGAKRLRGARRLVLSDSTARADSTG